MDKKMFNLDVMLYFTKSAVVIVDIDNTLLRNGIYPIKKTIEYVNELAKTNKIYIITGRPSSDREDTEKALRNAKVKFNRLMMNNIGQSPKEQIESKKKNAESIKEKILFAIDDKKDMRDAYRQIGIKTKSPAG